MLLILLLFLGAAWDKNVQTIVESEPKLLFVPLPVLWVSANKKDDEMKLRKELYGPQGTLLNNYHILLFYFYC